MKLPAPPDAATFVSCVREEVAKISWWGNPQVRPFLCHGCSVCAAIESVLYGRGSVCYIDLSH